MRSVFALGLLISLYAPVSAATVHHPRTRHHVIVRPSQSVVVPRGTSFTAIRPYLRRRIEILIRLPSEALVAVAPERSAAMAVWFVVML
jgi:hypothetical protein